MTDDLISQLLDTPDDDLLPTPAGERLRLTIPRHVLQALLDKASTVVPSHDVMAVLKNFLVNADTERLRITATDLELSMIATTPLVTVHTPGTCVLPAKKMLSIVREAADADVNLRVTGLSAHIIIGRASWTLKLAGGDDYPPMPAIADISYAEVERQALIDALTVVKYAASRDPNRASLNMIDIRQGRMIAADGARFQQALLAWFPVDMQIPIAAVDHLLRLLKLSDLDRVHIGQSEHHLIFRFATDVFLVNKLVAQFPDMDKAFLAPALENKHELSTSTKELLAAVKRVRINADPESSAIALSIAGDGLTVTAKDKYGNTAAETIEAAWSGPARTVVVNHRFLIDLFRGHTGDTAVFKLGDDTKTRKSMLLLDDREHGGVGVVQQMNADWITR